MVERAMPSLEQSVKEQFAKVFESKDWKIFKEVAEVNLGEAAVLKKSSFSTVAKGRKLLIRNIRKRLLIGIGAELLVKAVYLKSGYCINKPRDKKAGSKVPIKLEGVALGDLDPNDTFKFSVLIDQLKTLPETLKQGVVSKGLNIAKVYRNKEGHVVTHKHKFDRESYAAIEAAIVEIYAAIFRQELKIKFSLQPNEKGIWQVAG